MKILSFGEVLWDVYPDEKFLGGAPLNFAAHCVKCGLSAGMFTAVGNDELGKATVKAINSLNVNTELVSVSEKQTGQCLVTLDKNRVPSYNLLEDVAYDHITYAEDISGYDFLYFGTLALRSNGNFKVLEKLIKENSFEEIVVDLNLRSPHYSSRSVNFALSNAGIVKISDEEFPKVMEIIGESFTGCTNAAKMLCEEYPGIKLLLITMGTDGAFVYKSTTGEFFYQPGEKVTVKSTVGAGDSFTAAFISHYLAGRSISESLKTAVKLSAYVVSHIDAIPDYDKNHI